MTGGRGVLSSSRSDENLPRGEGGYIEATPLWPLPWLGDLARDDVLSAMKRGGVRECLAEEERPKTACKRLQVLINRAAQSLSSFSQWPQPPTPLATGTGLNTLA